MITKMGRRWALFFFLFILAAALVIGGCASSTSSDTKVSSEDKLEEVEVSGGENSAANTVAITSSGFSPSALTIKRGETVAFINKDSQGHWPASAMHPTHTVYPGSDIAKCGTNEQEKNFDACRSLMQGETFSFQFDEAGSWNYHDHLNPSRTGKIVVE